MAVVAGGAAVLYLWHGYRLRRLAMKRLAELVGRAPEPERRDEQLVRTVKSFPPRHRYLPPSVACLVAAALWFAAVPIEVAVAAGVLVSVLSHLIEVHVAEGHTATIEMQLAEAIDLLVGSLRAGTSPRRV